MISSQDLLIHNENEFLQQWGDVCDRYETTLDKISKGIHLSEFAAESADNELKRCKDYVAEFKEFYERSKLNIEDINSSLDIEKELNSQKEQRFNQVSEECKPFDPLSGVKEAKEKLEQQQYEATLVEEKLYTLAQKTNQKAYDKGYNAMVKSKDEGAKKVVQLLLQVLKATEMHAFNMDQTQTSLKGHVNWCKLLQECVPSSTSNEQFDLIEKEFKTIFNTEDTEKFVWLKNNSDFAFYFEFLKLLIQQGRIDNEIRALVIACDEEYQKKRGVSNEEKKSKRNQVNQYLVDISQTQFKELQDTIETNEACLDDQLVAYNQLLEYVGEEGLKYEYTKYDKTQKIQNFTVPTDLKINFEGVIFTPINPVEDDKNPVMKTIQSILDEGNQQKVEQSMAQLDQEEQKQNEEPLIQKEPHQEEQKQNEEPLIQKEPYQEEQKHYQDPIIQKKPIQEATDPAPAGSGNIAQWQSSRLLIH